MWVDKFTTAELVLTMSCGAEINMQVILCISDVINKLQLLGRTMLPATG